MGSVEIRGGEIVRRVFCKEKFFVFFKTKTIKDFAILMNIVRVIWVAINLVRI
jgi:hypothetical protein